MKPSRKMKISGIFIALLLTISGCSSNAAPTTSPVKVEDSKPIKTQDQPDATAIKDAVSTPSTTAPTAAPAVVVAPATTPAVTPAPTPTAQKVVVPVPVDPPVVTPAPASKETPQTVTVYVTKTGKKYHRDGCKSLSQSKIPISLSDAKSKYSPCSICNPPQ